MFLFGGVWFIGVPFLLLEWEESRIAAFRPFPWNVLGALLFLAGVLLACYAGYYLVTYGDGTPFPLAPTISLVTSGPYAQVRNPQAIAATLMVLGEIAAIPSRYLPVLLPLTIAYLEFLAAPIEDRELTMRFGSAYIAYKERVPKWVPRRDV